MQDQVIDRPLADPIHRPGGPPLQLDRDAAEELAPHKLPGLGSVLYGVQTGCHYGHGVDCWSACSGGTGMGVRGSFAQSAPSGGVAAAHQEQLKLRVLDLCKGRILLAHSC